MRVTIATLLLVIALCSLASTSLAAGATAAAAAAPVVAPKAGIIGLGAMTETVFQEGQSSFSGIAMRLRIRNARFRPNLELMPTMEYWQNTSSLAAFNVRTRRRDATLGLDLRWVFGNKKAWQPYAGAGYSVHFLEDELHIPGVDESSGSTRGGFSALGGVEFNLGERLGSFVEFKYHHVPDYRQLKLNLGLSWNF